jgi:hypothetical protein
MTCSICYLISSALPFEELCPSESFYQPPLTALVDLNLPLLSSLLLTLNCSGFFVETIVGNIGDESGDGFVRYKVIGEESGDTTCDEEDKNSTEDAN